MNDFGITLAWLAVQVALLMAPALALNLWASRRGPAAGASVAATALILVLALSVATWFVGRAREAVSSPALPPASSLTAVPTTQPRTGEALSVAAPSSDAGWRFDRLPLTWRLLERGVAEPVARCRPWGAALAGFVLAGMGLGLLRLALGLGAVSLCRRRGRSVDDPEIVALRDELARALAIVRRVELREIDDLPGPATAGWLRPTILLPADWKSWSVDERRAVLAHELAHIAGGDYATGLLARLALAIHFYHPMVRMAVGKLGLQQEQAADALAARLAGGTDRYLAALSRLALMQDGRSPAWAARGFLAGRGTLIRRIAMLREQTGTRAFETSSRLPSFLSAGLLAALAIGVGSLRGPVLAEETAHLGEPALAFPYLNANHCGLVSIRPAAAVHRMGADIVLRFATAVLDLGPQLSIDYVAKELGVNANVPGFLKPGFGDVESVTFGFGFGHGSNAERKDLHSIFFSGLCVRMTAPFDWLAFVRQWGGELTEVHEGSRTYYRITAPWTPSKRPLPCVLLVDERTAIFDEEPPLIAAIRGESKPPALFASPDWQDASRGLFAVAIGNEDGKFLKQYDLGPDVHREDDQIAMALFRGVDRWLLSVTDADTLSISASAACRNEVVNEVVAAAMEKLLVGGRDAVAKAEAVTPIRGEDDLFIHIGKAVLPKLRIDRDNHLLKIETHDVGTVAEAAAFITNLMANAQPRPASKP
ncbi:M56 family metallopeptidase [Paludisphaera rhizosphaerae]|uniref:M56 family metallopeptidase n=1 Tax=Paludisphaera rhizosphaerae TaxID=2711216 RepID=UPI0013EC3223|nr:M56 family metallopeptidase [Paludisphaera rhizosphaerae]